VADHPEADVEGERLSAVGCWLSARKWLGGGGDADFDAVGVREDERDIKLVARKGGWHWRAASA
jgi:hypothetical protein